VPYKDADKRRAYARQHYENNRERYKEQSRASNKQRIEGNRLQLWIYLLSHPCVDCDESDPIVLQFDHLPGLEVKFMDVSKMVHDGYSWATITKEIKKCEVVCANCHIRRTATRGKWFKLEMTYRQAVVDKFGGVRMIPVPINLDQDG
jgi:hypothetical protein